MYCFVNPQASCEIGLLANGENKWTCFHTEPRSSSLLVPFYVSLIDTIDCSLARLAYLVLKE